MSVSMRSSEQVRLLRKKSRHMPSWVGIRRKSYICEMLTRRLRPETLMTSSAEPRRTSDDSEAVNPRQHPIQVLHLTSVEKTNYFLNNLVDYCDRYAVE